MDSANETPVAQEFRVKEVDSVEIISLVDNFVDFLSTVNKRQVQSVRQWTKECYGEEWVRTHSQLPCAEHGFSMLVRVVRAGKTNSILFDVGISPEGVVENAERMGINLSEVESIVISHGHYDHFGGLLSAVEAVNKEALPIIVHENMFETRGSANSKGKIRKYPEFPAEAQLSPARFVSTKQPSLTADDIVCITGEIPRKTSFETGFTRHRAFVKGSWRADPWIMDERAVAISIKGKGLVVLSGCAHAGIINTVAYAQQITGIEKIYAVMGGFHLAGKSFESRIQPTIEELQRVNPELIVPSHCTGWRAMCAMAKAFPESFLWNSVGNLYQF